MRSTRRLGLLVLCPALTFAQTLPNFSGVFLESQTQGRLVKRAWARTPENPLVLQIEQTPDNLQVTEFLNGSQATFVFNLNGKPSINDWPGEGQSSDRLTFRDGRLVIRSERGTHWAFGALQEESWKLSSDLQTLAIQPTLKGPRNMVRPDVFEIETYTREMALQPALEKAAKASRANTCVTAPTHPLKRPRDISRGVELWGTTFKQLGSTESFDAILSGGFFTNLKLIPAPGGVELRRNQELVSRFSGPLTLTVRPTIKREPNGLGSTTFIVMMGEGLFTDALKGLRFHLLWVGSETRDLGEIPAELKSEVLFKNLPAEYWYQMEVSSSDVPITVSLEIHILSPAGNQLGCISGHL